MREPPLLGDHIRQGRSARASFDPPRLVVEPLDRGEHFVPPEPGLLHRRLHDADRLVIDLERDREGMSVLAAMGERKASGIGESVRRAVNDFGHHRQRPHRPGADARHEQQFGKVGRPPIRGRREARVKARRQHVARADVMMSGHDEMRQRELARIGRRRGLARLCLDRGQFARQAVRTQGLQQFELAPAGGDPRGDR